MDRIVVITSLLTAQGTYHNHKERMAYNAATLYMAGATALILAPPFWQFYPKPAFVLFVVALIAIAAIGFVYVRWQLRMRRIAAVRVSACWNLATIWLHTSPTPADLEPSVETVQSLHRSALVFPKALIEQFGPVGEITDQGLRTSVFTTYLIMIAWAGVAIVRVLTSFGP